VGKADEETPENMQLLKFLESQLSGYKKKGKRDSWKHATRKKRRRYQEGENSEDRRKRFVGSGDSTPLGQKSLEKAQVPRGGCFKLWAKTSCSCFLHSPRSHVGDFLWNSEPDSRRQFSLCFLSAFFCFQENAFSYRKCQNVSSKTHPGRVQFFLEIIVLFCRIQSLLKGSFAKETYKRDCILQKKPIILRSLPIVATPYSSKHATKAKKKLLGRGDS